MTLKTTEKNILPTHANLTLTLSQCEPTDLLVQDFDKFAVENESHTSGNTSLDAHELSTTTGFGFGYITYFVLEEIIVTQLMKKGVFICVQFVRFPFAMCSVRFRKALASEKAVLNTKIIMAAPQLTLLTIQ